jgi:hypothetical protein
VRERDKKEEEEKALQQMVLKLLFKLRFKQDRENE